MQLRDTAAKKTFRKADCLPVDCDNTNPDPLAEDIPASEWKTPADVRAAFPDVPFYVVYSRNHMKEKNGKTARPKFHVYFIINDMTSEKRLAKLKRMFRSISRLSTRRLLIWHDSFMA